MKSGAAVPSGNQRSEPSTLSTTTSQGALSWSSYRTPDTPSSTTLHRRARSTGNNSPSMTPSRSGCKTGSFVISNKSVATQGWRINSAVSNPAHRQHRDRMTAADEIVHEPRLVTARGSVQEHFVMIGKRGGDHDRLFIGGVRRKRASPVAAEGSRSMDQCVESPASNIAPGLLAASSWCQVA